MWTRCIQRSMEFQTSRFNVGCCPYCHISKSFSTHTATLPITRPLYPRKSQQKQGKLPIRRCDGKGLVGRDDIRILWFEVRLFHDCLGDNISFSIGTTSHFNFGDEVESDVCGRKCSVDPVGLSADGDFSRKRMSEGVHTADILLANRDSIAGSLRASRLSRRLRPLLVLYVGERCLWSARNTWERNMRPKRRDAVKLELFACGRRRSTHWTSRPSRTMCPCASSSGRALLQSVVELHTDHVP